MTRGRAIGVAARVVATVLGAALVLYGVALHRSDDFFVEKAWRHAGSHRPGDPSKAAAGGNLLEFFTDLFGWGAILVGGALLVVALIPWSRFARSR